MVMNFETAFRFDACGQRIYLITLEISRPPTFLADYQVFMSGKAPNKRVAAGGSVDTLDQAQLLQLVNRPVNGDQAEFWIINTRFFVDVQGAQDMFAARNDLNHCLARSRKTVAVGLQALEPF